MDSCDKQVNKGNNTASYERENPRFCAKGCGFYGTPATHNLCSKCFIDFLKKEAAKTEADKPSQPLDNPKNLFPCVNDTTKANASTNNVSSAFSAVKNRCFCCKKKIGMMGFSCRCGGTFCGTHRYPEEHACTFDFKTAGRVALANQNLVCNGDKLDQRI